MTQRDHLLHCVAVAPDPPALVPGVDAPPEGGSGGSATTQSHTGDDAEAGPPPPPPPSGKGRSGRRFATGDRSAKRAPRKARRVKRTIRRVELWSVLKVSLLFYVCMYVVALASLALLWGFAHSAGLVDNFEGFMSDVGFENWRFYGEEIFRRCAIIGAILVLTGALLTTLATALLNVISELTGGIRVVVIEEVPLPAPAPAAAPAPLGDPAPDPVAAPARPRRRRLRRRPPVLAPTVPGEGHAG